MSPLYCFFAAEGLVFLKRGYLPFCSPVQLADPWMQLNSQYQQHAAPSLALEDFHHHLQQQYEQLPDNLRSMISFDYFVQQSQGKREQIEASLVNKQRQRVPIFNSSSVQNWRILELFSQWQDANLWQKFSASGQGLVVEFDVHSPSFTSDTYNNQAQHFSQVKQVEHWEPCDDVYYFFNQPTATHDLEANNSSRQQVWRLIRPLAAADRQIEVQAAVRAMYRLPCRAVRRVILGYGCSTDYCQQVQLYLSQDIHYRHVECLQAQISPKTMRLEAVSLI